MALTRRELLRQSGVALGATALLSRFGALSAMAQTGGGDYKALVCVFLHGGNDAYNMVIPADTGEYNYYRSKRPDIGLNQDQLLRIYPQDADHAGRSFGLPPYFGPTGGLTGGYGAGLHELFGTGRLAVVCNMGTLKYPIDRATYIDNPGSRPRSLYDHNEQQRQQQDLDLIQGWGNSVGGLTTQMHTNPRLPMLVNVTAGSAVYLAGTEPYVTIKDNGSSLIIQVGQAAGQLPSGSRYNGLRQLQVLDMNDSNTLMRVMAEKKSSAIDNGEVAFTALRDSTTTVTFPSNNGLATQLAQIARIIKNRDALGTNRRQIFFASMGGFDNHSGQAEAHPVLLLYLSAAMRAFYDEMAAQGIADKVTTFTLSDFGRTFAQNGDPNPGTDHAWGSHYLVMGGAVNGGRFYGRYPQIEGIIDAGSPYNVDSGRIGRFIPDTSVDEFAATLAHWFGVRDVDIATVMPNIGYFYRPTPPYLGFMYT